MDGTRTNVNVTLPRPITSLIGRDEELNHLYELLLSEVALVTITGFGGIGKTRLSLQAALELEPNFDAGAIFVSLASVTKGSSIPRAIAMTAGLDESIATIPDLAAALGESSRLLVLDNLEQIPDAAEVVFELLQAMPNATILATSRSRLDLTGEYVLPLEPLETQSDNPRALPAVQLFSERDRAASPSMPTDDAAIQVIAEICQKLDGIPLAIELAAARLSIFSLTDLRDQLVNILPVLAGKRVDMPDRQRTMRNAIAWTYELLDTSERRLFSWLSVYEQGFSLDSVQHVAQQLELTDAPIDIVQFLVSRSLIRPSRRESEAPRYQMLQMLQEFGHEQLVATSEDQLARRSHAMDMVALAERSRPHLRTDQATTWFRLLNDDIANFRETIRWSLQNDRDDLVLRIIGSVHRFLNPYGYESEFLGYVRDTENVQLDDERMARALIGIGNLQHELLLMNPARATFSRARELATGLPDQNILADSIMGLGYVAMDTGNLAEAEQHFIRSQELGRELQNVRTQYASTGMLATTKVLQGDTDASIDLFKQVLELTRINEDVPNEIVVATNLGVALQYAGRLQESDVCFHHSIALSEQTGNARSLAHALTTLSFNRYLSGELEAARDYAEQGVELARKLRLNQFEINGLNTLVAVEIESRNFGTAALLIQLTQELMQEATTVRQFFTSASALVEIMLELERPIDAATLMGAITKLREESVREVPYWAEAKEERFRSDLESFHDPRVTAAFEAGSQMDLSELVDLINTLTPVVTRLSPPKSVVEIPPRQEPKTNRLTPRETEVLEMLAKGLTNDEIADELFLSTRTVTTHLSNIFGKLEVKNRTAAIAIASEEGLI